MKFSNCSLRIAGALTLAAMFLTQTLPAGEPMGWRNDGSGRFPTAKPPTEWSREKNIAWKTRLPDRSLASPIVVADSVFLMSEPADLLCLAARDGELLWKRSHTYPDVFGPEKGSKIEADLKTAAGIKKESEVLQQQRHDLKKAGGTVEELAALESRIKPLEEQHRALTTYRPIPGGSTGNTTSTPVSDGQHVYAVFGTGVVSSHALDGTRRWMIVLEAPRGDHSASPLFCGDKLIVQLRGLTALEPKTGEVLWKAEAHSRPGSAVAARIGDVDVLVTAAGEVIRASDGRVLWKDQFNLGYCSPIAHAGVVYAMLEGKVKALRLPELDSDTRGPAIAWEAEAARNNRLASPLCHDGLLYSVTEQGILEVFETESGDPVYRERLAFKDGRPDPSLCLAGDYLFVSSNDGTTVILKPGREFEELSRNKLEEFSSTPTFVRDRIYIRTTKHLYCIAPP